MIVRECRPAGNLVPDAHLTALALEHGLTVVSTDTDFAKFPGVTRLNPVSATALWRLASRWPAAPLHPVDMHRGPFGRKSLEPNGRWL